MGDLICLLATVRTLKCLRYCVLPFVVKGVPMDPNSENAFPEKKKNNQTPYIWRLLKNVNISERKSEK